MRQNEEKYSKLSLIESSQLRNIKCIRRKIADTRTKLNIKNYLILIIFIRILM